MHRTQMANNKANAEEKKKIEQKDVMFSSLITRYQDVYLLSVLKKYMITTTLAVSTIN